MKKLLFLTLAALPFIAATQTVPSYVPTNGLVGWWPFNGNANDESGNGNNGTVNGATLTADRNGNTNCAYSFDGVNDFIEISSNSSLQLSNFYTINGWFNANVFFLTNINDRRIISKTQSTGWYGGYEVFIGGTTNDIAHTGNVNGNNFVIGSTGYSINTWYMFTVTYDNNSMKLYMNDVLVNSQPMTGSLQTGNVPLRFGKIDGQISGLFEGIIDDIGIWNRALDSCEVKDLYFASLGNCCNASITTQPVSQNAINGGNAVFTTASSNTSASYQWQSDVGFGFQNLSNAGQYSGVNTATLTVSNISALNNNQSFRCLVSSGACSDTSDVVYILNTTGVNESISKNIISISPNPAKDVVNVTWLQTNIKVLLLRDASGRVVRTYNVSGKQASLSLEGLEAGVYFLCTSETSQAIQRIVKE
jgi:hypothetical protein